MLRGSVKPFPPGETIGTKGGSMAFGKAVHPLEVGKWCPHCKIMYQLWAKRCMFCGKRLKKIGNVRTKGVMNDTGLGTES